MLESDEFLIRSDKIPCMEVETHQLFLKSSLFKMFDVAGVVGDAASSSSERRVGRDALVGDVPVARLRRAGARGRGAGVAGGDGVRGAALPGQERVGHVAHLHAPRRRAHLPAAAPRRLLQPARALPRPALRLPRGPGDVTRPFHAIARKIHGMFKPFVNFATLTKFRRCSKYIDEQVL